VLLTQGTFYETLGWTATPPGEWDVVAPRLLTSPTRSRRGQLEEAERTLRAALDASPALDEARLRLGRVLTELGRPGEALTTLAPLYADASGTPVAVENSSPGSRARTMNERWSASRPYLVKLFIGSAEERLGHFDRAIEAYRAAAAMQPKCQTPWVALSAALRASGDQVAAADVVLKIATTATQCHDPWWDYRYGSWAWRAEPLFAAMRGEVR